MSDNLTLRNEDWEKTKTKHVKVRCEISPLLYSLGDFHSILTTLKCVNS